MYSIEEQMNIHYFFINHIRGVVMGFILFIFKETITKGSKEFDLKGVSNIGVGT